MDIVELLTACVDDARIIAQPLGVRIEADLSAPLPAKVDAPRITQIVLNLLDNAIKYNYRGGVAKLEGDVLGGEIFLTIGNTGPGIQKEHAPLLFERFFRFSAKPDTPGHGLGLCLAREIARAHHGDVTLTKSDAEWTVFTLRLPAGGAAHDPPAPHLAGVAG
jgi:signal transduction histidine kinase